MRERQPASPTLTVRALQGEEVLEVRELEVAFESPDGTSVTRTLGVMPVVLGTGVDCDWVVRDGGISRRHCELRLAPFGLRVRDLGSKNGSWSQGVRVTDGVLPEGASLSLGGSKLRVLPSSRDVTTVPLSPRREFGEALGQSPLMRALFALLEKAAGADVPVLLLGETGTGKEVLARALHAHGPRREQPFVTLDCGSTPPSLIEAELFGVEKGAYSGAETTRRGLVEEAHGGTLFLDEVGELPPESQTRLLRLLDARQFKRVGSSDYRDVDVRVVAATCRDLTARVEEGLFRKELYYRLAVLVARVPPLRERKEDIPLLVERFLGRHSPPMGLDAFPASALTLFESHDWPGNVRELLHTVTRLVLFPKLGAKALEVGVRAGRPTVPGEEYFGLSLRDGRSALVEGFERAYLQAKLRESRGNVAAAARSSGVSRQFFYRLLDAHGLREGPQPEDEGD